MKRSLVFLCLLFTILLMVSCAKKQGCTNEWADNYDREAIVDCCCSFSGLAIIESMLGEHILKESCSGIALDYGINISKDQETPDGIIISNFNNTGTAVKAQWNLNEFRLASDWTVDECQISLTGSINKAGGKMHFIYAAIPQGDDCEQFSGKTCEARQQ